MSEKLVDVLASNGNVIHTYPVTLDSTSDADFIAKGLEAAANGQLVSDADLSTLTARIHPSRRGRMSPYGDHYRVILRPSSVSPKKSASGHIISGNRKVG